MKKTFSIILAIILTLSLFTGCNNTDKDSVTEVTDENVKELFLPSLEVFVGFAGSGLYEVERNEDGTVKTFGVNDNGDTIYKVIGYDDPDKIESDYRQYVSEEAEKNYIGPFSAKDSFIKDGEDLYVTDGACGAFGYDKNSIKLKKYENGKYYISVDWYASDSYEPRYAGHQWFTVSIKNGNLYIEDMEYVALSDDDQIPPLEEIDWVSTFGKFNNFG